MFKIFLTNLGKYNEGELVGKWIELPCYDLDAELESIGVKENSQYEEYFITDYENEVGYEVGEYESVCDLNNLAEHLERIDNEGDTPKLKAYLEVYSDDIEEAIRRLDYCTFYPGYTIQQVAEELVDNGCFGDIPASIVNYIDYDAIARDLSFDNYYEAEDGVIYIL